MSAIYTLHDRRYGGEKIGEFSGPLFNAAPQGGIYDKARAVALEKGYYTGRIWMRSVQSGSVFNIPVWIGH